MPYLRYAMVFTEREREKEVGQHHQPPMVGSAWIFLFLWIIISRNVEVTHWCAQAFLLGRRDTIISWSDGKRTKPHKPREGHTFDELSMILGSVCCGLL